MFGELGELGAGWEKRSHRIKHVANIGSGKLLMVSTLLEDRNYILLQYRVVPSSYTHLKINLINPAQTQDF